MICISLLKMFYILREIAFSPDSMYRFGLTQKGNSEFKDRPEKI